MTIWLLLLAMFPSRLPASPIFAPDSVTLRLLWSPPPRKLVLHGPLRIIGASELGMGDSAALDRKSTRLNSSHSDRSRMPSSA